MSPAKSHAAEVDRFKGMAPIPKFTVTPKPVITRENTLICTVTTVRR